MIGYDAMVTHAAAIVDLPVGLVSVSGPDALTFLQSLLSQDLDDLAVGDTRHALLLEPQGKLIADHHVVRVAEDDYWLRCEPEVAAQLASGLARFKIRVKLAIEDRTAQSRRVIVCGPHAAEVVPVAPTGVGVVRTDWTIDSLVVSKFEFIGPAELVTGIELGTIEPADAEALETLRIEARVPRQPHDIDERTIAQEASLDVDAVSFTKGCFVGQELVCRIDSRGHVNRTLRRITASAPIPLAADVSYEGKIVGSITSSAISPRSGPIALATLRREVPAGAPITVGDLGATCLDGP